MSMTDPIADMLARIRNAILARKTKVEVPASKFKRSIAELLHTEGFLQDVAVLEGGKPETLVLSLRYTDNREPAIAGLRRVSRPGQRRYVGHSDIPRVRSGLGVAVLTTSRGLMTDREARKLGVGGEVIFEVW
jgi:small subunit ribosomal protein S8